MCYYNSCKVSRADYIRLLAIEKELKNLKLSIAVQSGFEYGNFPIIKASNDKKDIEIKMAHWEYIPSFIKDEFDLKEARIMNTWLNAKGENLFVNDKGNRSMYREGALNGRCLVLSTGFYEWRHIPKLGKKGQPLKATEKIPYFITAAGEKEYFFMAGICRQWTNESRGQSADTFAIVTTQANSLMEKIHNSKKRMPVILPEPLAYEWLFGQLDEKRILELATYQYNSDEMIAHPVDKRFLSAEDPSNKVIYENEPPLL